MAKISEVPGITGETLVLFEASGFGELRIFLGMAVPEILAKLQEVNETYHLAARLPSQTAILAWQKAARILERGGMSREGARGAAFTATLVSEADLAAAGIDLDAVPLASPFVEEDGGPPSCSKEERLHEAGFDLNAGRPDPDSSQDSPGSPDQGEGGNPSESEGAEPGSPQLPLRKLDPVPKALQKGDQPSNLVKVPQAEEGRGGESADSPERIRLEPDQEPGRGAPRPAGSVRVLADLEPKRREADGNSSTEPGGPGLDLRRHMEEDGIASPEGRRRTRGLRHASPWRVWFGAGVTLLVFVLGVLTAVGFVGGVVAGVVVKWRMPSWAPWLLAALPAALVLYLLVGTRPRCRLCGQRLMVPKGCQPHVNARRSIWGYTVGLAWDAFRLRSFHCVFCGTKSRTRK